MDDEEVSPPNHVQHEVAFFASELDHAIEADVAQLPTTVDDTSSAKRVPNPTGKKAQPKNLKAPKAFKKASKSKKKRQNIEPLKICPVCLDTTAQLKRRAVKMIITCCGHEFCQKCMSQWKARRLKDGRMLTCPVCRCRLFGAMRTVEL